MKKTIICFLFLMLTSAVVVYAAQKGSEKITLDGGNLGQVTLPHWTHQTSLQGDCNACHNLFAQTPQVIKKMKKEGQLKKKQVMNQCIDCHKDLKAQAKTSGPVSCKACHTK